MNTIYNYLLEANLCLLIFGFLYYIALKNETHFRFSRYYIVASALLAVIIPLLHFDNPFEGSAAMPIVSELQPMTLPGLAIGTAVVAETSQEAVSWSWPSVAVIIYGIITAIFLTLFFYQLYQILQFRRLKRKDIARKEDHVLIPTDGQLPTFSFFNMLFFDNSVALPEEDKQKIIDHELVHIREWHSLDTLVLEFTKILFWINPVAWWMRKNIRDVHEYLADQQVLKNTNQEHYSSLLAKVALKHLPLPLGHHFNRSLTLKRIKMMKSPKTKFKSWKWATMVTIMALITLALSCNDKETDDVSLVLETTSPVEMPATFQAELERLQKKYPEAEFFYLETNGNNIKDLTKQKDFDPMNIAHIKVWEERGRIGAIIVDNYGRLAAPLTPKKDADGVYRTVEEFAKPVGGYKEFHKQVARVLQYPEEARKAGVEGNVYVQFVVDTDGTLTNMKVVKGIGHGCDEAAIAAITAAKPFKPAYQDGEAVKQRFVLPVGFSLITNSNLSREMKIDLQKEGLTLFGKITNLDGEPLSGVKIRIIRTSHETISDKAGNFNLKIFNDNDKIHFTHFFYDSQKISLSQ